MTERFTVTAEQNTNVVSTFGRKGLAFAYAKRHALNPQNGKMRVQRDLQDGANWKPYDAWTFEADGNYDHQRL